MAGACVAFCTLAACGGSTAKPIPSAEQLAKRLERAGLCLEPEAIKSPPHSVGCKENDQADSPYIITAFPTHDALVRKVRDSERFFCRLDPSNPFAYVGGPTWVVVGVVNESGVAGTLHGEVVNGKACPSHTTALKD